MSTDAPKDESAAPGFLPPHRKNVPLVLQVSPLDAESSGVDEFFFDPFANIKIGDLQRHGPFLSVTAKLLSSTSALIQLPSKRCFR